MPPPTESRRSLNNALAAAERKPLARLMRAANRLAFLAFRGLGLTYANTDDSASRGADRLLNRYRHKGRDPHNGHLGYKLLDVYMIGDPAELKAANQRIHHMRKVRFTRRERRRDPELRQVIAHRRASRLVPEPRA